MDGKKDAADQKKSEIGWRSSLAPKSLPTYLYLYMPLRLCEKEKNKWAVSDVIQHVGKVYR